MKFDKGIVDENLSNFITYLSDPGKYKSYSFDLPDGFNNVPVITQVRTHAELMTSEDKMGVGEKVTRIMITGKPVEIFLEGKSLGKFIMNGNAEWDSIPQLTQYPFALNALIEICLGDMMGKYLPPLKDTAENSQVEAKEKA